MDDPESWKIGGEGNMRWMIEMLNKFEKLENWMKRIETGGPQTRESHEGG